MLHAKVDLTLAYHPKAHAAGRAMASWTWALLYTREQELDGFVPASALRLSWVGEAQATRDMASLVAVGLLAVVDGGWQILNYAAKNETKAAVDARKEADRKRKKKVPPFPTGIRSESVTTPGGFPPQGIPGSGSGSGSDLGEGVQGERPTTGVRVAEMPDWFREAAETVEMNTGLATTELPALWLEYLGARHRKGWRPDKLDAASWLSAVLRSDRAKAKARAPAEKPPGLVEHEKRKQTPEEARAFGERLRAAMARQKGTGT